ncbi:unnamed protein product [Calypogeia fissa]
MAGERVQEAVGMMIVDGDLSRDRSTAVGFELLLLSMLIEDVLRDRAISLVFGCLREVNRLCHPNCWEVVGWRHV